MDSAVLEWSNYLLSEKEGEKKKWDWLGKIEQWESVIPE